MSTEKSYGQILKASSIMGGAAGITLLLSMLKVKFAAVLIGANGVGLNASFIALQNVIGTVAGLGLQSSGVREIASEVSRDNQEAIGRKILVLRRLCWLTGLLGMASVMLLSTLLSQFTFGHQEYALDIAMLGCVIFFTIVAGGESAIIQGTRCIDLLAKVNIFSAAVGTVAGVIFYLGLGIHGVAPALVIASAAQFLLSWHFARRIPVRRVALTIRQTFTEANGMIRLGLVMMFNGLLVSAVTYITILLITRQEGIGAVGYYSAAFSLSGMFVNFVLNAMAADYYPRLTGLVADKTSMSHHVNQQTEVAILLALPGLVATLALSPWIVKIFYSADFTGAEKLLQWFILGCMGRVISWPLSYVLLALGRGWLFLLTETIFNLLHVVLIFAGLRYFGIEGVAIAFFVMYLGYIATVYYGCKYLIVFTWSSDSLRLAIFAVLTLGAAFLACRFLPLLIASSLGLLLTLVISVFCLRGMVRRIGPDHRITKSISKVRGARTLLIPK